MHNGNGLILDLVNDDVADADLAVIVEEEDVSSVVGGLHTSTKESGVKS